MLENLFAFPIVLVDGEEEMKKEERNKMMALDMEDDRDVIIAEAEVPYFDFLGIIDRWGFTRESKNKAKKGVFDHCMVMFLNSGTFIVPWNKNKFKEKISEFAKAQVPVVIKVVPKKKKGKDVPDNNSEGNTGQ